MISKLFLLFLLFLFLLLPCLALAADTQIINPSDSGYDQDIINTALQQGDVYLNQGIYSITGPIYVPRNTILSGDPAARILVSSDISSPWFNPYVGVINVLDPFNVQIKGFEIDGNCQNLNNDWASSPGHKKDQEQLIKVIGSSGNFGKNIIISGMKLHNSFGDGIQIRCIDGIICSDNEIINTQHEGIYFSASKNCKAINNRIASITSDGIRFDNCINGEAESNIIWQYDGPNNNGAYKGGSNGIQVANAGSSHGYNAKKDWISTKNIEIHNNTISAPGGKGILLGSAGSDPANNVFIHDNVYLNTAELRTMGIPVDDYSIENPPTIEQSEDIFTSLFDILDRKFTDSGRTEQKGEDIAYTVKKTDSGIISGGIKIQGFKDVVKIDNVSYIPDDKSVLVKYEAVKSPSLNFFGTGIEKIDNKVDTKIKDGKANAVLTVTTKYYTVSTNHITKNPKKNFKTTTATFEDSYSPAPAILNRSTTTKAYVNVFNDTKNPVAKVRIVHTNTTQLIEFTYGENKTSHKFMMGERITDQAGVQYTAYSRCDLWNGSIQHMGDELVIIGKFDPTQLHIKYYTPYEVSEVEDIEIIYNKAEGESYFMTTLKFIVYMLFAMYAGYQIMKIAI